MENNLNLNKITVYYPLWEMECCGNPFKLEDKIKWIITNYDSDDYFDIKEEIDYLYSAHEKYEENKFYILTGIIYEIIMIYYKYREENNTLYPPKFQKVNLIKSFKFIRELDGFEADSYVVKIINPTIRPAKKAEITYE